MENGKRFSLRVCLVVSIITLFLPLMGQGQQGIGDLDDDGQFAAETKQVNQFFRRFNCEESIKGERYYPNDNLYRNAEMRKAYVEGLFDEQNPYLTRVLRETFIQDVTDEEAPAFLDFHGGDWFAEVHATFTFEGKEEQALLFLKLQEQEIGSKWVFDGVYLDRYYQFYLPPDSIPTDSFLHPLSHEIDFMNLEKLFRRSDKLTPFASKEYQPDFLTLFIYEMQQGKLRFQTITEVRFHFLQVPNWYFEIAQIIRPGTNRGWLISKLTQIPEDKKDILTRYIYNNYQ